MKTISRLALAALLTTGVAGTAIVAPASAQKKDKKAPAGPTYTPAVLTAARIAQPAIAARDFATAEPALVQVEAAAVTDDDKYIAAALRYDFEQQRLYGNRDANPKAPIDETVLAKPLDTLLANPKTPAADRGRYAFRRGALAFNGKQYPVAIQLFTQAKQLGYTNPDLGMFLVKAKVESGDVAGGTAELESEIARMNAAGQKAPEDYYRYAIARSNARKMNAETMSWVRKYIAAYPTQKNWRDVILTYGLSQNSIATLDGGQKIDLFRLMRASGSLADQYDYEDYAQKLLDRGLPAEAQAVIKEGQARGKIPAAAANSRMILTDAATALRNETSLTAVEARSRTAADGKLASQTADAYLSQGNYTKAADLYRVALSKSGVNADEVNTRLGIALARGGDKAGATAAFEAVKGAPRADIASLWVAWLNGPTPTA
jgi:hypothetical protein